MKIYRLLFIVSVAAVLSLFFQNCTSSFQVSESTGEASSTLKEPLLVDSEIDAILNFVHPLGGCKTPVQESVDISQWPEIFVGTVKDSCSDDESAGSRARPFCNPHLAFQKSPPNGGIIFTFLEGEYRLSQFQNPNRSNSPTSLVLPRVNGSENEFLVVRAEKGAKPVFLSSLRISDGWESYSGVGGSRVFRRNIGDFPQEIYGIWQVIEGPEKIYNQARRPRHMMVFINGRRSHSNVSDLADNQSGRPESSMTESAANHDFTWTKADVNGVGCNSGSNNGCYIYLRVDDQAYNPNDFDFEVAQYAGITGGGSYMVIDGLHTRFSQSNEVHFTNIDSALIQNNSIAHLAAGNGNSYALGIWSTNGSIVRKNRIFDSAYWGGTPNSKGLTYMISGQGESNWACHNEIFHIPGEAAIGTKRGVYGLKVIGNYIHDSYVCIHSTGDRIQEGERFAGGGWDVRQNRIERCTRGYVPGNEDDNYVEPDSVSNNLFINNFHGLYLGNKPIAKSKFYNNMFIGGPYSNSCEENGWRCGSGVYFGNNSGTILEYEHIFNNQGLQIKNNLFFNLTFTHGINRNWTPNYHNYSSLEEFQTEWSVYGGESGSIFADPMLGENYQLESGSPAKGSGLGGLNIGIDSE